MREPTRRWLVWRSSCCEGAALGVQPEPADAGNHDRSWDERGLICCEYRRSSLQRGAEEQAEHRGGADGYC